MNKITFSLSLFGIAVASLLAVFAVSNNSATAQQPNTIDICHATGAGTYVVNSPAVSGLDPVSNGNHASHADDIIPPIPGILPDGLNWDEFGQAVYANGCDVTAVLPVNITFVVECNEQGTIDVVLSNAGDLTGIADVNGTAVSVAPMGQNSVNYADDTPVAINIDGAEVYSDTLDCVAEEPEEEVEEEPEEEVEEEVEEEPVVEEPSQPVPQVKSHYIAPAGPVKAGVAPATN